ncbi:unnamed protein product [Cuscuta europaea]|uniref:Uncharacterized protein n=1 Tax=Cuscuta europaea TaxID=41803 RepID=A0A9P0ZM25_CUSEU|nr:unnamed protein product [Cuscuta europaea]
MEWFFFSRDSGWEDRGKRLLNRSRQFKVDYMRLCVAVQHKDSSKLIAEFRSLRQQQIFINIKSCLGREVDGSNVQSSVGAHSMLKVRDLHEDEDGMESNDE